MLTKSYFVVAVKSRFCVKGFRELIWSSDYVEDPPPPAIFASIWILLYVYGSIFPGHFVYTFSSYCYISPTSCTIGVINSLIASYCSVYPKLVSG